MAGFFICTLLFVLISLTTPALASPLPLTTTHTGIVSGGVYVGAFGHFNDGAQIDQQYSLPAFTSVQYARLELVGYASGTSAQSGTVTVMYDADSDGTFDTTIGSEHLNVTSSNDDEVYTATANADRNWGDYRVFYNITGLVTTRNPTVRVVTAKDAGGYYNIKDLTLIVAYDDGDADQVRYWVNTGHQYIYAGNGYAGETVFDASEAPAGFTSATLHDVSVGNFDAACMFNGNSITETSLILGSYFRSKTFDVTNDLTAGAKNTFGYSLNEGSFKTPLAVLEVRYPPLVPVAAFTANTTSGTAPLNVTFADASTNRPTSWYWDFGDNSTSTEQNPVHEYMAAGNYTVVLTATNNGRSDTVTKTGYITVAAAVIALPEQTAAPTDPDGEGLYEDLNGNGLAEFNDVVLYYTNIDWIIANEPVSAFDYNGNGAAEFNDVVIFYKKVLGGS